MYTRIQFLLALPITLACDKASLNTTNVTYGVIDDGRSKRSTSWDWIRIELYYDESVEALASEKLMILKRLISQARDYFEDTIKVERVRTLQLQPECSGGTYVRNKDFVKCGTDCIPGCGTAVAPVNTKIFVKCKCENRQCLTNFEEYVGTLNYADFILFVAIREGICDEHTLAYASRCSLHPVTKRPISGYVNICPYSFGKMQRNEMTRWLSMIKHELVHAFVFSVSHFTNFIGAKPATQHKPLPIVPGVIEKFTRDDWEVSGGKISHDVYMIVTPKVREEARKHFGCPTLEGAEVENQGGTGTAGSHWEKRVFENEALTGVATQVYALSRLTLALFEDSGWYQVNYDKAENMTWGKGLGCDFAKKSCLSWMKGSKDPYPFCTRALDMRCNADRKSKVSCNMIRRNEDLPKEYDYNIPKLYKDHKNRKVIAQGGEMVADYCPYYRVFGQISKEATDTRCTYSGNMYYNNYSLEIFSRSARCFSLHKGVKVRKKIRTTTYHLNVGCYETSCKENLLHVKVQSSKFYPCYYTGQFVHVEKFPACSRRWQSKNPNNMSTLS
ncbi:hypothetical protein RB195_015429 [Necator americanus]|uniref:Leishmanolysin-like peptidase n=1 Tax=Necator americanus TaxID=51031 RepID=A0ABR1E4J3_NECAM